MKCKIGLAVALVFLVLAVCAHHVRALDDGLAKTPPMGWNSWNKFGCDVSEKLIKEIADAMVTSGMKDAGYSYVVIDDCWQVRRDPDGTIVADPQRFPSGMKDLADYVHSKGLKFGLYSDAGTETCQGRPGSKGHEEQDAHQYAAWGIDYLKYDWCKTEGMKGPETYPIMRDALKKAGRPIVFSICEWGSSQPWLWAANVGHLWRTTGDILDCWDCEENWGGMGWTKILDKQVGLEKYAGPGHWNDPDMLEVGNKGMNATEYRSHFSLWCILAAPLMAGNDLRSMSRKTAEILTNKEVIAVNQDPLGTEGTRLRDDGDTEVWMKPFSDGSKAVVLFNRGKQPARISVTAKEIGLTEQAKARDLWAHKDLGTIRDSYSASVPAHDVVMLRVTP